MAQGTRVTRNYFHENAGEDVFVEVDHGPFVVDNNLFLSPVSLLDMSEGGAYAHNLFAGKIISRAEPNRETPYHPAHTTAVAGLSKIRGGDDRFYNNIFIGSGESAHTREFGLCVYDPRELPLFASGNVYSRGAQPYRGELNCLVLSNSLPAISLGTDSGRATTELRLDANVRRANTQLVTSEMLGKALVPGLRYENADGSTFEIDRDFCGIRRNKSHPTAGPFERIHSGTVSVELP
jgi:hypothetical protein